MESGFESLLPSHSDSHAVSLAKQQYFGSLNILIIMQT